MQLYAWLSTSEACYDSLRPYQPATSNSYIYLVRIFTSLSQLYLQPTSARCFKMRYFVAKIQFSNFPTFEKERFFSISWQSETSKRRDSFNVSDAAIFWWIVRRVVQIVRDFSDEEMIRLWRSGDFIRGWVRRWRNRAIVNLPTNDIWLADDRSDRENQVEWSLVLKEKIFLAEEISDRWERFKPKN